MERSGGINVDECPTRVQTGTVTLDGDLCIPEGATGIVLFAHGSGSSRFSPRNRYVAQVLRNAGLATLLFDLLTSQEEAIDMRTGHLRFDIRLLADRLAGATDWVRQNLDTLKMKIGYFGASTGSRSGTGKCCQRRSFPRRTSRPCRKSPSPG